MRYQTLKFGFWIAVLAGLQAVPGYSGYQWVLDGGGMLNTDSGQQGAWGSLASDGTHMYTAYIEFDAAYSGRYRGYVKFNNNGAWETVGNTTCSINTGLAGSAGYPDIIATGTNRLWVAAGQKRTGPNISTFQLALTHWNGTDWNENYVLSNSTDADALFPSLAQYNGLPMVAWEEHSTILYYWKNVGHIYARRFNGLAWENMGAGYVDTESANEDAARPDLTIDPVTGTAYLAYLKGIVLNPSLEDPPINGNLYVKRFNGTDWEAVGTQVNSGHPYAYNPTIFHDGSQLLVAYNHFYGGTYGTTVRGYVRRWNGTDWEQIGSTFNNNPDSDAWYPVVTVDNGTIYVSSMQDWYNFPPGYQYMKFFNGSSWEGMGGPLYFDASMQTYDSDMGIHNHTPYLTWMEPPAANPGLNHAYTAYLQYVTPSSTPTVTATPTRSPTPNGTYTRTATPSPSPTHSPTPSPTITRFVLGDDRVIAFPNPAKDQVTFLYRLETSANVTVRIYDLNGKEVGRLTENNQPAGTGAGSVWQLGKVAGGIYLCRIMIEPINGESKREKTLKVVVAK